MQVNIDIPGYWQLCENIWNIATYHGVFGYVLRVFNGRTAGCSSTT